MTMRLGNGTKATIRARSKTWCDLVKITRKDGTVYRFTSHDQTIVADGESYSPTGAPAATNERRQDGLVDQSQDLVGPISSTDISEDDLNLGKFDGARLDVQVVNWRWPWRSYYSSVRWVSNVTRDANGWKFETVGFTQKLAQPAAGRFGGYFTPTCPYVLFGTHCRALEYDTQTAKAVDTVVGDTWQFTATSGFTNGYADDWYRDGEITWTTGDNAGVVSPIAGYEDSTRTITLLIPTPMPIVAGDTFTAKVGCDGLKSSCTEKFFETLSDSGTSTGGGTSLQMIDTGKSWTVNAYANLRVLIVRGTGAGQSRVIASNTSTVLTISTAWATTPDATSVYRIGTGNVLNFGGSPYDPGSGPALEVPR